MSPAEFFAASPREQAEWLGRFHAGMWDRGDLGEMAAWTRTRNTGPGETNHRPNPDGSPFDFLYDHGDRIGLHGSCPVKPGRTVGAAMIAELCRIEARGLEPCTDYWRINCLTREQWAPYEGSETDTF